MNPLAILSVGVAIVLGLILIARLNAFFALITAAIVVSLLAPEGEVDKITRVAAAFGETAGKIGIVIALAAVIGKCLLDSGAADRIAQAFLRLLGQQRGDVALAASGFVLSVPVFFDTVFYLLFPLARSMYRQTGNHYLRYLVAIGSGAVVTHTLVPPTPGPLLVAGNLGVDVGAMIMVGAVVAIPSALVGLIYGAWIDRQLVLAEDPAEAVDELSGPAERSLPGLVISVTPILLPVLLIASHTIVSQQASAVTEIGAAGAITGPAAVAAAVGNSYWDDAAEWTAIVGNANLALLLATVVALWLYARQCRPTREKTSAMVEEALMSAGVIILITAAGGAFGAMLKAADIAPAIQNAFSDSDRGLGGIALLWFAFGVSSLLKFAQGSSTVAMITASGMVGAMIGDAVTGQTALDFHPVYLAAAIGCGSMVGVWMNDSGFWIFCKMGRLTPREALKSWTVTTALCGIVGMLTTTALAAALPMVS